mgnify:CR=1 FL=1
MLVFNNRRMLHGRRAFVADGLRHLRGLFLVEIQRGPRVIPAPGPETRIDEGDVLVFSGQIDTVVDLLTAEQILNQELLNIS